jgi:cysteine-rich repeat protein
MRILFGVLFSLVVILLVSCSGPVVGQAIGDTCTDTILNQDETDIDCGGSVCGACEQGLACNLNIDCISNVCESDVCVPNPCGNGILDGSCSVLLDGDSVADCFENEGDWAGETCDDGNNVDGDGCSSTCQVEIVCGDGVCDVPYEDVESCVADCTVLGCTDTEAYNYDNTANQDDGSCLTCGDGECSEDFESPYTCSEDCGSPPVHGDTDNDGDADLDDAIAIVRSLLDITSEVTWVGCYQPGLEDAIGIIEGSSPFGEIFDGGCAS